MRQRRVRRGFLPQPQRGPLAPNPQRQETPRALCRGTLSAVAHGGNPQDRAASPPHWLLPVGRGGPESPISDCEPVDA
ncbi:hypothetical protein [Fischerella thermalis]|uniref:hypothetical protein n=1 Tax=Fischerella thermalis TaxID=372787 RepID=UPI0011C043DB|nr:hypothetical protein [Fischerella thermalis]